MKTYINTKQAKRARAKNFIEALFSTSLILIIILLIFFTTTGYLCPQLATSAIPLIVMGILSTIIGLQAGSHLTHMPVPEIALGEGLKGLPHSAIYHYYAPEDHLLITSQGIYVLTIRSQATKVTFTGDHMAIEDNLFKKFQRLINQTGLGKPIYEAKAKAENIRTWLAKNAPDLQLPITPVVVFTHSKSSITVTDPPSLIVAYSDKRKPSLKQLVKAPEHSTDANDAIDRLNGIFGIPPNL